AAQRPRPGRALLPRPAWLRAHRGFFFSSRRRHTRFSRDWSSDVCSSDLQIVRPPALLYVRGNSTCLNLPQIAIVGSRSPTPGGRDNAFAFARHLAASGFAVTSGLALGIDGAAHSGALAASGATIAVFGTGIDTIYPARHRDLAQQIIDGGGALVSEFPLATRSQASNFPQRNRLISGLSCGTLV